MQNPNALVPKAVKRVHEIFEKPTFMAKPSGSDVKQGGLGDCWLMASFSGLANVEDGIKRICVAHDTKIGIYGFVFFRDGEWIYSIIDDKLYLKSPCWDSPSMQRDLLQQIDREDVERVYRKTYQTGSKALFFAQCKDQNETWVPLMEKAYAKAHGDFTSLSGGWIGEGLEDLSGGVTTELLASDILDIDSFWENELSRVNEEFLFGCSTGLLDGGYGDRDGIAEGHAYNVMRACTLKNGTRLVQLRNPWGKVRKGIWEGAWSDGSKEWTTEVQEELGYNFGGDSVFWISYEDMLRKYQHLDRTRLFREPDWRCCQRWIGVDVPWKPQFNEKFNIKLTKESPLVLVLAQLDNRYYKGLHGQYSFRLHFRLHDADRPGAEDYIVRSHGNYLMDRSVSVELPSMLPGNYSVFISVEGERNSSAPSIEDVVRRECKKRVENEKLAQIGYAYDLAHSKATAHLQAVEAARNKADQKKASASRSSERHKLWEKRHANRDVTKKQGRKNNEKIEAKREKKEEIARIKKEKEEAEAKVKADAEAKAKAGAEAKAKAEVGKVAQSGGVQIAVAPATPPETPFNQKPEDVKTKTKTEEHDYFSKALSHVKAEEAQSPGAVTPDWSPVVTPCTPAEHTDIKPEDRTELTAENKTKEGPASVTSSNSSGSPNLTPKTETSVAEHTSKTEKVTVPPTDVTAVSGAPLAAATPTTESKPSTEADAPPAKKVAKKVYATSDGESSASPISDWEELYSSDDMSRKPRLANNSAAASATVYKYNDDTDSESDPDPWNAICVVGFRVYSKDEDLQLRVVMEGADLEEGGMGEKGEPDLDNAQNNAGGQRGRHMSTVDVPVSKDVFQMEGKNRIEEVEGYEGDSESDVEKKRARRERKKGKKTDRESSGEEEEESGTEHPAGYKTIVRKGDKSLEGEGEE